MFGTKEIGIALDSRECVVVAQKRRGELEELRYPALAQIRGNEIRAVGQRAYRLVGKSRDVVSVFPGRIEDPLILGGYLRQVVPRRSSLQRQRLWATVPTGSGLQSLLNLKSCLEGSVSPRDIVLVPELLAAAVGAGFPVLRGEEDSHRARMIIHLGGSRIAAGVFVDGGLTGLVVREGCWDQLVREVQENLQFRLGTNLGLNTFFKVVKSLSRSFFDRHGGFPTNRAPITGEPGPGLSEKSASTAHEASELIPADSESAAELVSEISAPPNLRSFNERGLIEYVVEDETVSRAIDIQLKQLLFGLEKVVFGCFSRLRSEGRGEIAGDLFGDRVMLCGDIFFDPSALTDYFTRLSRFRFEAINGHAVTKGLRRILSSASPQRRSYRELSSNIQEDGRHVFASV